MDSIRGICGVRKSCVWAWPQFAHLRRSGPSRRSRRMSTRMHHQRGHVPCIRGVARVPAHQAPAGEPVRNPRVPRASAALACAHARAPLPAGNTQCLDTLAESRLNCAATKHSCALYDAPFQMRRPRPGSAPDQLGASAFGDLGASIADAGAGVEALYAQALSQAVQRGQRARRSVAGALRALQATRAQPLSRAPFAKIQPPGLGQPSGQLGAGAEASSDVGSAVPAHAPHRGPIHPAPRIAAKQLPESATFEVRLCCRVGIVCGASARPVFEQACVSPLPRDSGTDVHISVCTSKVKCWARGVACSRACVCVFACVTVLAHCALAAPQEPTRKPAVLVLA